MPHLGPGTQKNKQEPDLWWNRRYQTADFQPATQRLRRHMAILRYLWAGTASSACMPCHRRLALLAWRLHFFSSGTRSERKQAPYLYCAPGGQNSTVSLHTFGRVAIRIRHERVKPFRFYFSKWAALVTKVQCQSYQWMPVEVPAMPKPCVLAHWRAGSRIVSTTARFVFQSSINK